MCNYDISMTHNQTYNLTTHNSLAVPAMELGIDVPLVLCSMSGTHQSLNQLINKTQLFSRGL